MLKKISFPEPSCRYHCSHFKSVGPSLNETHYCVKKEKNGKRFSKKDSKRKPSAWRPFRLNPPTYRIYDLRNELQEMLAFDEWLSIDPTKVGWCSPIFRRHQLRQKIPLGMTAEQFYTAAREPTVDEILDGVPV